MTLFLMQKLFLFICEFVKSSNFVFNYNLCFPPNIYVDRFTSIVLCFEIRIVYFSLLSSRLLATNKRVSVKYQIAIFFSHIHVRN